MTAAGYRATAINPGQHILPQDIRASCHAVKSRGRELFPDTVPDKATAAVCKNINREGELMDTHRCFYGEGEVRVPSYGEDSKTNYSAEHLNGFSTVIDAPRVESAHQDKANESLSNHHPNFVESTDMTFINCYSEHKGWPSDNLKITSAFSLSSHSSSIALSNQYKDLKTFSSKEASTAARNETNGRDRDVDITSNFEYANKLLMERKESRLTQQCDLADNQQNLQRQRTKHTLKVKFDPWFKKKLSSIEAFFETIPRSSSQHLDQESSYGEQTFLFPRLKTLDEEQTDHAIFVPSKMQFPCSPYELVKATTEKTRTLAGNMVESISDAAKSAQYWTSPFSNIQSTRKRVTRQTLQSPGTSQPNDALARPSVCFEAIRKTKQSQGIDERIVLDMMKRGMPSSLCTTSASHLLPIVSNFMEKTDQPSDYSKRKRPLEYEGKTGACSRIKKISVGNFRKFETKCETRRQNVERGDNTTAPFLPDPSSQADGLTSINNWSKGSLKPDEIKLPSLNTSPAKLFITPAPIPFGDLELAFPFENDGVESITKIPNNFLDLPDKSKCHAESQGSTQQFRNFKEVYLPCDTAKDTSQKNGKHTRGYIGEKPSSFTKSRAKEAENRKALRPLKKRALSLNAESQKRSAFSLVCKESLAKSDKCTHVLSSGKPTMPGEAEKTCSSPIPHKEEKVFRTGGEKCSLNSAQSPSNKSESKSTVHTFEPTIKDFSSLEVDDILKARSFNVVVSKGCEESTSKIDINGRQFEGRCKLIPTSKSIGPSVFTEIHSWSVDHTICGKQTLEEKSFSSAPGEGSSSSEDHRFLAMDDSQCNGNSDSDVCSNHTDASDSGDGAPVMPSSERCAKKYKCEECGKAFGRSNTLVTHTRIHTGDRPFMCDLCGRAFRQLGNLTRHKLTHTEAKPYACPKCNKCFSRTSNLHTHMRTHTNYKPFVCEFCGKGFHQKVDMKIHRYTHTGEKPHKCNKCGRGFKQLTHLKYHMRTHSDIRMYSCQYCGKGFNQKGNLQAHIYGHTGDRPYKCDTCGKGFTLTSTLNTHKRTHAPTKPFKCDFCNKAFYQKNALKTHYISSHPYTDGVCLL